MNRYALKTGKFLLFVFAFGAGLLITRQTTHRRAYLTVCNLVFEKFYRLEPDLIRWHEGCVQRANQAVWLVSRKALLRDIRAQLFEIGVSHLDVYSPREESRIWAGTDADTGLRLVDVDGHRVVMRVLQDSPAQKAGVAVGDELVSINGHTEFTIYQAEVVEGEFLFLRGEDQISILLQPRRLQIDSAPFVRDLGQGRRLLRIESFRSEYFTPEGWRPTFNQLNGASHIVIDVRGNIGGNFVAMLRALSGFVCREARIGRLEQPRKGAVSVGRFDDQLDQEAQLRAFDQYSDIELWTFTGYGCSVAKISVLINDRTASVAEMFVEALQQFRSARTYGQRTAGDVVLATWYHLNELGAGYSVSIPEANYRTESGSELEGVGIAADQPVDQNYEDARQGLDTVLKSALSH